MTPTTWLLLFASGWIGGGLFLAMLLGRRGFNSVSWLLIGAVLGPMALPIAWSCVHHDEQLRPTVVATKRRSHGGVSVLVGFDGSDECRAAIGAMQRALGNRLGRVALATVVPYDDPPEDERSARSTLEAAGREFEELRADLILVRGRPAKALAEEAAIGGFELLVIGSTGRGRAHLFGSAAKELLQHSPVPVLVAGQHAVPTGAPDERRRAA
jgi:nucleotide-binding universal stress UspA family protein